jgi:competence protein ComEC
MGLVILGSAARAHGAIVRHERARATMLDRAWPALCTLTGRVSRSPAMLGGGLRLDVVAREVRCADAPLAGPLRVGLHVPGDGSFARGDEITAIASLAPPYRFWNDGLSDPRPHAARRAVVLSGGAEDAVVVREGRGVGAAIDRARAHLRERILGTFPPDTAPMARALVLGEDDLPEQDSRAFRRSGLAHLLAVSGMHLVLVVMGFVAAVRAVLVRAPPLAARMDVGRVAAAVGLPLAWAYADLAGGSGSAVRAAWMCTVALVARVFARRPEPWRALGLSVAAMWIVDPLVAFDLSFVLSALATAGLLGLARPIEALLRARARVLPAPIARPLATTAAATIACAPVLALMAPELPLAGLVANVVAVPLGETLALPLCLVHGLLAAWPAAERGCAAAASGALLLVRVVARAFVWGGLPVPPPTAAQLAAIAVATLGAALGRPSRWIVSGAAALVALEIVVRIRGAPRGVLRVTFIDVGQGDAALVDLPDGSAMLVDGGGLVGSPIDVGERAVAPLLAARRRGELAAVVLSHPHPDHYLGLASGLARVRVRALWDTGQGLGEGTGGAYAGVLAQAATRGVPVLGPAELCGARELGGATVEVLAPCPGFVPDRGANDNSFVLRIRHGARAVLFMGDAEREEERELVEAVARRGGALAADVLKVGHHGSRTSSSAALLDAVRPGVAVISCGVRNRFGHPHAATLDALARSRVLRTDRDGSVVVTTDGEELDVRAIAKP